jgi:hypothetical protein
MKKTISIALLALSAGGAFAQSGKDSEAPKSYWGLQGGGAYSWVPQALADQAQNKYTATLDGTTYDVGLVRFHPSGAPSFSLEFVHFSMDAKATENTTGIGYSGHVDVPGFLATKYVNFMVRRRFNFGMSFGGGVGPQLHASYQEIGNPTGGTPPAKTYTLTQIPVTPMFQILFRGDVRVHRFISVGPYAGISTLFPTVGGTVRFHFVR